MHTEPIGFRMRECGGNTALCPHPQTRGCDSYSSRIADAEVRVEIDTLCLCCLTSRHRSVDDSGTTVGAENRWKDSVYVENQCLNRYDLTSSVRERTWDVRMQENRVVSRQLT